MSRVDPSVHCTIYRRMHTTIRVKALLMLDADVAVSQLE